MPERMSRSGAELHRRENQSKVIQDRLTNVEQHLGQLCDISSSYTRKTARLRDKGDLMAKQMMEFSEYEKWNPTLSQGLAKCAENFSAVQDYREVQVKRLESKVVSPLVNYGLLCKQTKNDLRAAFAANDRESSQMRKLETLKNKHPTEKQKILENELKRTSLDASRNAKALEQQIEGFEAKKLKDLKKIMREFVTVEMHFHAKALEMYTQCFQSLDSIDPEKDLEEFRRQLQPNGSVRSDLARSASQASLESQSRQGSAQSTPRRSTVNAGDTTGSADTRRRMPLPNPQIRVNNAEDDSGEDDEDDSEEDDDDDEYESEDYTETVTDKSGRRR